jgi:hypothetical protein
MMARLPLHLLAVAFLLTAKIAFAFPSSRLVYARGDGAESCPPEAFLRQAVAARLGYDPFFVSADKTIIAEIARDRSELRGRVALVDERGLVQGAREFRLPPGQCDELVATMALAVSIAVDPTLDSPVIETAAASAATAASRKADATAEATKKMPEPRPAPKLERDTPAPWPVAPPGSPPPGGLETRAGLSLTSSFGTAPATAFGIAGSFGILLERFSLSVEGRRDFAASVSVPEGGTAGASLWVGSLVSCFHLKFWFGCGLGAIGSLHATGANLIASRAGNALYAAAGARVGVEVRLGGPIFFRPELEALANLSRVEFRVDETTPWKASPVSLMIGTGLFFSFR